MNQLSNKYDLEERTAKFGEEIIALCKNIILDIINRPIINQLIRSATSIGANYTEANNACSKKDFKNKIYICKKEAQESMHWLRMLERCSPEKAKEIKIFWQEAKELTMIFQKITNSLRC